MSRQVERVHASPRPGSAPADIVWAVVLAAVAILGTDTHKQAVFLVFLGETLGWLGATIARSVYPPPGARPAQPR